MYSSYKFLLHALVSINLTSIPIGLFDKCTQVKSFDNCFYNNQLTSIPIGLFDKCTQVTNFSICFYNNQVELQFQPWTF